MLLAVCLLDMDVDDDDGCFSGELSHPHIRYGLLYAAFVSRKRDEE